MLQFLVGFSLVAFFLAIIYGLDWLIFHERPKDTASYVDLFFLSDVVVLNGVFGMIVGAALLIVIVILLCLYAFRYLVSGREHAPPLRWLFDRKHQRRRPNIPPPVAAPGA